VPSLLRLFYPWQPTYAQTNQGINWLEICKSPMVDAVVVEPCETLTTSGGYGLTAQGERVVGCILGAGVLLYAYPTAFYTAQELAKKAGLCAGMTAPLTTNPNNNALGSSSSSDPLGNLLSGLTTGNSPSSGSSNDPIGNLLGNLLGR
jgi:hypothetical protein